MEPSDASFADFVSLHGPGLLAFARGLTGNTPDAEDLLQNALAGAYARWPRIRPDKALAYVRRSLANGRVSLWRRTRPTIGLDIDRPMAGQHDQETVDRLALRQALSGLPRSQRAVLVMRYLLDLPDNEIAEALGVGLPTVRSHAHRGLRSIRRYMDYEPTKTTPAQLVSSDLAVSPRRQP